MGAQAGRVSDHLRPPTGLRARARGGFLDACASSQTYSSARVPSRRGTHRVMLQPRDKFSPNAATHDSANLHCAGDAPHPCHPSFCSVVLGCLRRTGKTLGG
ncbi:unnamed protein product [Prorocentrum cordatum]|uniref:Uncharacterized protein n=1 Tax=Prorocentrum cordatum TaxID=2364126 RepID=A0ABN9XUM0_9DINO|nr:unnamed protein product [Polarella glacialis]